MDSAPFRMFCSTVFDYIRPIPGWQGGKRRWAPAAEGEAGPGRQKNWTEGGNCTKSPEKGVEREKGIQYIHLFGKNERRKKNEMGGK